MKLALKAHRVKQDKRGRIILAERVTKKSRIELKLSHHLISTSIIIEIVSL